MTPLFKSTHDALRFAYRFNGDNTVSARFGDAPSGNGKGLGGLDGAAQAGMIQSEVRRLGETIEAVAVAQFAIPYTPAWKKAVVQVVRHMVSISPRFKALELAVFLYAYFGQGGVTQETMAQRLGIHRNTVSKRYREVLRYLGNRRNRGLCDEVNLRIDKALRASGIVGNENND